MAQEREEAQDAEAAEPRAASKLVPLLVLLGCLTAGTGAGAFVLGPKLFAAPAPADDHGEAAEPAAGSHGKKNKHGEATALVTLENLVVNPANSGGTRFLLISVAFEPKDETVAAALVAAEPRLRDTYVMLLGKRSIAELSDVAIRDTIRADMLAAATAIVPGILRIYIPQFVLQ